MSRKDAKITLADLPPRLRREVAGLEPVGETKKRHKYGVCPKEERTYDGIVFDSKKEMTRWIELRAMQQAGVIRELQRQFRLPLFVKAEFIGDYIADFRYVEGTKAIYEDTKGGKATKTPLYRWKKKHVYAQYGIQIRET